MTRKVFVELARVAKPGGHVAYEVGAVWGGATPLERLVWAERNGQPFKQLGVFINHQLFINTSNCWGVAHNAKGVNASRLVVARRIQPARSNLIASSRSNR
ncbi:MAG: hypothetical protein N2444_02295 [Methylocystis sp.]|nr:hypothetical protein [Methylocystis sp.]